MVLRLAVLAALCVLLSCVGAPPVPCTECAGVCVWVQTDPAHCGGCGKTCSSGQLCKAGACVATCAAPQLACAGKCVDVKNDAANCGTCGTACGAAEFCSMGACASISACATGQVSCSGVCTTTATDQANCGACGNACAAGTGCSAGLCAVSCTGSLTKCSPDAGVTCANLQTDNANCGGCGVACAAGRACVAGSCQATCTVGLTSCPSGCANFANDSLNCGACGVVCDELSKCTNGGCVDPFAVPRLCSQLPPDSGIPNDGGFVRRTVYAFGRSDAPLPVRCGLDGGTWLELQNDGGLGNNFSRRAPGGFFTVGPEVVTRYSAVRIDYRFPNELLISNVDDRTFAVSTGSQTQGNSNNPSTYTVNSMSYGSASACVGGNNAAGTGNINLTGLPVAVTRTSWAGGGFMVAGGATLSSFNQVVSVTGGGFCGDIYPSEGLVRLTLCTAPGVEACDKKDNNCDGLIDNLPDAGLCP